jgi:activator of 2-hydroxyglutaryl-CoA dehydratase
MCVVFAETEIIGLLASGESLANIVAGVQHAIASRIASMAGRRVAEPVVFTGGVANIALMDKAIEEKLGYPVKVAANAQLTGALGAALLAAREK